MSGNRQMKMTAGIFILALMASLFGSCQKSYGPTGPTPEGDVISLHTGYVTGKVVTANNNPLIGATVTIGKMVAYTNTKGEYYLSNITIGDRVLVNFSLDGYTTTQKIAVVRNRQTTTIDAALLPLGANQNLNAASGGTVQFSGASVVLPANALVDAKGNAFKGTAQVKATYFDPSTAQFYGCFPGEFSGVRSDNTVTGIESFGFISVDLYNGNEKLQIAPGQQSTITIPIPAAMTAKAPQSIPLWYYDESKGRWIEEGSAAKTGGKYVGSVRHFSKWNADMPNETSYLEGIVVDKNGAPISFAAVHSTGIDYTGSSNAFTDDAGRFKLAVKSVANAKVWASYFIVSSTPQNIATPATGQILNIGTITIPFDAQDFCNIVGRLVDNGNLPVPNVSIQLLDSTNKKIDYLYTNKDGKFKFLGEPGRKYALLITVYLDSAQTTTRIDVICPSQVQTVDLGDIKLNIGGSTVIGRVVNASNVPLANVNVYSVASSSANQQRETKTDSTGVFSLWVRPNITFKINLYYQGATKVVNAASGNLGETRDLGDIVFP